MKAIVAVDKNWAIGCKGKLLVHIPEDLKYFKERTLGGILICGRKTLSTFPDAKPLPGRTTFLLTSDLNYVSNYDNLKIYNSVNDIIKDIKSEKRNVWVIGGGQVYSQLLPYCDECVVSKMDFEAETPDTFFENLDNNDDFYLEQIEAKKSSSVPFSVYTYKRHK